MAEKRYSADGQWTGLGDAFTSIACQFLGRIANAVANDAGISMRSMSRVINPEVDSRPFANGSKLLAIVLSIYISLE